MHRLCRLFKVRFNYWLDRVIEFCDMVLMDAYRLPWASWQRIARWVARYVGDVSWLLRAFPRLPACKLVGENWTVVFVGLEHSLREIERLLFEQGASQQYLGRVALWKLGSQARQWFASGADLVVCELGRIHPRTPRATFTFSVPVWVQQVLTIPDPPEELLAGRSLEKIRRGIRRAQKAGYDYKFSCAQSDFDHFYYHMYLPFVEKRHGDLAMITPYQDQWRRWFTRGGLVLATLHDTPVAGMLCYIAHRTCFCVEGGIAEADPHLFEQGMNAVNIWYAISWAYSQGAKTFDLGGTHAWCSNGSFFFKRRWGARVVRRKRIYGKWVFLAQDLSPALRDHINRLGFISEADDGFYAVCLHTDSSPAAEADVDEQLLTVKGRGLEGLAVVSANSNLTVCH